MKFTAVLVLAIVSTAFTSAQQNPSPEQKTTQSISLSGSVLRADTRAPLRNAQVALVGPSAQTQSSEMDESSQQGARRYGATTDENGNFVFENLKPGLYRLNATHAGMILKAASEWGTVIQLQAGHPQKVTLLMLPGGAIVGRIVNEQGEPMQEVSVMAMRYRYSLQGRHLFPEGNATSNDKGEYRLFGLKPGSYLVMAGGKESGEEALQALPKADDSKAGVRIYASTYYQNETSPEQATPIWVKPGDEVQANFSLSRVPAHSISGKVVGLAPAPAPEDKDAERVQFITLMSQGMPLQTTASASITKDATFTVPAVPSGKYTLMVVDTDRKGSVSYGLKNVVVDSADVAGVTVVLNQAKGELSGTIHADNDAKVDLSKLTVTLVPAHPHDFGGGFTEEAMGSGYAQVKSDGSFKARVAPGSTLVYPFLMARSGGLEDWFLSKVLLNGKDVLESGFRIVDAQRGRLEIIISANGGRIEGTALDSEKNPFADAQIIAFPSEPSLRRRFDLLQQTTADHQGRFKLRGVRPGEYMVMALEDAQEQPFAEDAFLTQYADRIRTVKVGQSTEPIQLQTIPIGDR